MPDYTILILFIGLSLVAEIAGTVGGFGSSVFFVPMAAYFFDFYSVLGITAIFHLSSNVAKIFLFKKGIDKKLILLLGVPSVIFVLLGSYLTSFFDSFWLVLLLNIFLIAIAALFLIKPSFELKQTPVNAITGGALSGFLAGIIGTGGAIRGITMAAFNLPKEIFVATSAVIDLAIDLSRSGVYFFKGYIHYHDLYLVPILIVVSFIGTYIGQWVLHKIPQHKFRMISIALICIIALAGIINVF